MLKSTIECWRMLTTLYSRSYRLNRQPFFCSRFLANSFQLSHSISKYVVIDSTQSSALQSATFAVALCWHWPSGDDAAVRQLAYLSARTRAMIRIVLILTIFSDSCSMAICLGCALFLIPFGFDRTVSGQLISIATRLLRILVTTPSSITLLSQKEFLQVASSSTYWNVCIVPVDRRLANAVYSIWDLKIEEETCTPSLNIMKTITTVLF